jgi:hypothetical protein
MRLARISFPGMALASELAALGAALDTASLGPGTLDYQGRTREAC